MSRERLSALIVDDERLARQELRTLLAVHPEVEVRGEAASVDEAARQLAGSSRTSSSWTSRCRGNRGSISSPARPCRAEWSS